METFGLDMQLNLAMKGGGSKRETMDDLDSDACCKRLSHSNGATGPCRGTPVTCNPARLPVQIHPSTMLIIVFVKQSPQWSEKL